MNLIKKIIGTLIFIMFATINYIMILPIVMLMRAPISIFRDMREFYYDIWY